MHIVISNNPTSTTSPTKFLRQVAVQALGRNHKVTLHGTSQWLAEIAAQEPSLLTHANIQHAVDVLPNDCIRPTPRNESVDHFNTLLGILINAKPDVIICGSDFERTTDIKKYLRNTFLVTSKFLDTQVTKELIEATYENLLNSRANMAIAISNKYLGLVSLEKNVLTLSKDSFAATLLTKIEERACASFSNTIYADIELPATSLGQTLADFTNHWNALKLFPQYLANGNHPGQFGFVAGRTTATSALITGRGQAKANITETDFVPIVLDEALTVTIPSSHEESKATLNAPLAKGLFLKYPSLKFLVHCHFTLPGCFTFKRSSQPGTANDSKVLEHLPESLDLTTQGYGFNQTDHGCFILLSSLEQFRVFLLEHNLYSKGGQYYEDTYRRFIASDSLLSVVKHPVTAILDYGGGTGALSRLLAKRYPKAFHYDPSSSMQAQAKKIEGLTVLDTLDKDHTFDCIVMRQCINYIPPQEWKTFFSKLNTHLKPGGSIVFNTFTPMSYTPVSRSYHIEEPEFSAYYEEASVVKDNIIQHMQRAELYLPVSEVIVDYNEFFNTPHDIKSFLPADMKPEITLNNASVYVQLYKA